MYIHTYNDKPYLCFIFLFQGLSNEFALAISRQLCFDTRGTEVSAVTYLGIRATCVHVHDIAVHRRQQTEPEVVKHVHCVSASRVSLVNMEAVRTDIAEEMDDIEIDGDTIDESELGHNMGGIGRTIEVHSEEPSESEDGLSDIDEQCTSAITVRAVGAKESIHKEVSTDITYDHLDKVSCKCPEDVKRGKPSTEFIDDTKRTQHKETRRNLFKTKLRTSLFRKSKTYTVSQQTECEENTDLTSGGSWSIRGPESTSSNSAKTTEVTGTQETLEEREEIAVHPMNSVIRDRLVQWKKRPKKKFKLSQLLSCTCTRA